MGAIGEEVQGAFAREIEREIAVEMAENLIFS